MKSKLPSKGDLVKVGAGWQVDHIGLNNIIGIVMETEQRSRGLDDMNDPIYEDGCWVMFPSADWLYDRTRWHWLENYRLEIISPP